MRAVAAWLLAVSAGAASAASGSEATGADAPGCAERLEWTLIAMQERPLLKEEHATALMWLRMDAAEAEAAGDEAACLAKVVVAEGLLGLSSN